MTERRRTYIETSIVSYLTGRLSSDLMLAAWQKITIDWWETQRERFDLFTSDVTMEEAGRGDANASKRRLEVLSDIPVLELTDAVSELAKALIEKSAIPATAPDDALHVAVCAVHRIDYLLTWNFRHLDNAETKPAIRAVIIAEGYTPPEICTPQELMGGAIDDQRDH